VSQIDYRLTDAWCDPVGQSDRWHSEKLLRLPNGFLCYRPPDGAPTVNDLPALRSECVTFASFSNYAKLSDPCVATWAEVLRAVPGSRLRLKSRGLADSEVVARLRGRFGAAGIEPDRILADGKLVSVHDHLAQYHDVDLALDPFPYNGTTTTCEALLMGIPVVTLAGATHVSRVGVSLMTRVGHPECIADTSEQYIAIAAALANDLPRLAEIRRALRPQMHRSSLCNAPQFAAEFTAAVRSVIAS
jgi:predicted O-linked N-acetylglucosamine transferase (SPINDLY family)